MPPRQQYIVTIKVDSVNGTCHAGHNVGDRWQTSSPDAPLTICPVALVAIWQKVYAMILGADFWFADNPDVAYFSCPDRGIVTFRIERRKKGGKIIRKPNARKKKI